MSKKVTSTDLSSSDLNDETSSSDGQRRKSSRRTRKKDSIKNYVTNVLSKQSEDDDQHIDLTRTQMRIGTGPDSSHGYENVSAFRRYQSNTDPATTTDSQRQHRQSSSSGEELRDDTLSEQVTQ